MNKQEIYLSLYKENNDHARHHESQRTTMSNLTLIITAGIGSIISMDKALTLYDLPFSIFIILLGTFGIIFTKKYGSRLAYHLMVAKEMLRHISPQIHTELTKSRALAEEKNTYSLWLRKKSITEYWVIIFIGCILTGLIIVSSS